MNDSKNKLKETMERWYQTHSRRHTLPRIDVHQHAVVREPLSKGPQVSVGDSSDMESPSVPEVALFASHDSFGVVDLGATKTVIGSDNLPTLIQSLHPEIRKNLQRCKCQVTFRFGIMVPSKVNMHLWYPFRISG